MTGGISDHDIYSEQNHRYLPVLFEDKVYLVSKSTTCHSLILTGINGYKNATILLRDFARLYNNDSLRAEGFIWDEETIQIMESLPSEYRTIKGEIYWTEIKECIPERDFFRACYGVQCMTDEGLEHKPLYIWGGRYGKQGYPVKAKLRPLIRLDPDTIMDVDMITNYLEAPIKIYRVS